MRGIDISLLQAAKQASCKASELQSKQAAKQARRGLIRFLVAKIFWWTQRLVMYLF
jgi:hypothetical protein